MIIVVTCQVSDDCSQPANNRKRVRPLEVCSGSDHNVPCRYSTDTGTIEVKEITDSQSCGSVLPGVTNAAKVEQLSVVTAANIDNTCCWRTGTGVDRLNILTQAVNIAVSGRSSNLQQVGSAVFVTEVYAAPAA